MKKKTLFLSRGEVVAHGDQYDEYKYRESGKMSVSLSSICDVNVHDVLQKNDAVAVIDCFTFVPEFMPVMENAYSIWN